MNANVLDTQPWYKEPWPWILMAGPAIVVVAGFLTAWLAFVSDDGVVEDDYYKQGLAVHQQLYRDTVATEKKATAQVMVSGLGVRVFLDMANAADLPAQLQLHFIHPTRDGLDQDIVLTKEGQTFYSGALTMEVHGRWHVYLEDQDKTWRLLGDWQPDAGTPLQLAAQGTSATTP
ncbi:membrane protein [Betaproteobacteria bacterium]|nr:membrane protein [Betaproteobacteria bacterium]